MSLTPWQDLGLLIALAIVAASLAWSSGKPPPTMVTAAVAFITLAILAAWVADPNRADSLIPLLGVGLGGLVAALSNIFRPPGDDDDEVPPPSTDG